MEESASFPSTHIALTEASQADAWQVANHPVQEWLLTAKGAYQRIATFLTQWPDLGFLPTQSPEDRTLISDQFYYPVPLDVVVGLMRSQPLPPPPGQLLPEHTDCDDYALTLKVGISAWSRQWRQNAGIDIPPPALGLIFTGDHVLCIFITPNLAGGLAVGVADPSVPGYPVAFGSDNKARALFRTGPVQWLFL